jgi:hypothetical protein
VVGCGAALGIIECDSGSLMMLRSAYWRAGEEDLKSKCEPEMHSEMTQSWWKNTNLRGVGDWMELLEGTRQMGLGSTVDVGPLANLCPRLDVREQRGQEEWANKVDFKTGLLVYMSTILETKHQSRVQNCGETIRKR